MANIGRYTFSAMASPCEVQVETRDPALTEELGRIAETEARRIETKYSRYRDDSVIASINGSLGEALQVDDETAALLDYADSCHALSDGLFDVTSGVLRQAWRFDGSANVPDAHEVEALMQQVGWSKVTWQAPRIVLPAGMEIDFGGLGKEYAVDSALMKITQASNLPVLVNFGGDLRVSGPREENRPWVVAIDAADGKGDPAAGLQLSGGALATSGDARRFLLKDGVRYSHILDPRTGWPVTGAPRSVTVAAATCMEAGILSTLAMLHGADAEEFLRSEGVRSWVLREDRAA